jgi:ribonuclease T2
LNVDHIQKLVKFATKHNLCIAVAGTGGDFNNRHSCDQGMMIRTALMKDIEWDSKDSKGFGHPSVRLGPGNTFAEVHYSGSLQEPSSFIAAGWGQSVGVVGWHLGGGHGPFARSKGLGVDNILEVEVVLANGTVAIATEQSHADLLWALRGGGGSVWGVMASITVRAHVAPADGFTDVSWTTSTGLCSTDIDSAAEEFMQMVTNLDKRWGFVVMMKAHGEEPSWTNLWCGRRYSALADFVFLGGQQDPTFQQDFEKMKIGLKKLSTTLLPMTVKNHKDWIHHYDTVPISTDQYTNGTQMVGDLIHDTYLIRQEHFSNMTQRLKDTLRRTAVGDGAAMQVFSWQGLNNPMAAADGATSISPKARGAEFHILSDHPGWDDLVDTSYFNESPYVQADESWKKRYWDSNYPRLLSIKQHYDPEGAFWCHNCVGSDLPVPELDTPLLLV